MKNIEDSLSRSIQDITPDVLPKIISSTPSLPDETYWIYEAPSHHRIFTIRLISCLAACIILILGFRYYMQNIRIDSTINLDVNPSIELLTNRKNEVRRANALNKDGEVILSNMDLSNTNLDVAVNAIIGSMVKTGYLSELQNSILVTVENRSTEKSEELQHSIVNDIKSMLSQNHIEGVIYNQSMTKSDDISDIANQYGISHGKAAFLIKLANKDTSLNMEQLSQLSMEEIAILISEKKLDISDLAGYEFDETILENLEDIIEDSDELLDDMGNRRDDAEPYDDDYDNNGYEHDDNRYDDHDNPYERDDNRYDDHDNDIDEEDDWYDEDD